MLTRLTLKSFLLPMFLFCFIGLFAQSKSPKISYTNAKCLGKTSQLRSWSSKSEYYKENKKRNKELKNKLKEIPNFKNSSPAVRDFSANILPKNGDPLVKLNKQYTQKTKLDTIQELMNLEGIDLNIAQVNPPDCNGDIGLKYYIEGSNGGFSSILRVFDKFTGEIVDEIPTAPFWEELGTNPVGDIIIIFDRFDQRWVIAEITFNSIVVAISVTSDPLGEYNAYEFPTDQLPDYPKIGNWKDAYYITTNEFNDGSNPLYVIPKDKILLGNCEVPIIKFLDIPQTDNGSIEINMPLNFSGKMAPEESTNFMSIRMLDDEWPGVDSDKLEYYEFITDFDNPENSTINGPFEIELAPFESNLCNFSIFDCIVQPDGSTVSAIATVIMNSVQYRNFGDYESILLSFSVDINGDDESGIRWVELRKQGTDEWSLYQEGTFTLEDGVSRFMGAISQDSEGNIILGYAMGSIDKFLGVGYTGRFAGDPLGVMTLGEQVLIEGQSNNLTPRWGDYFSMTVDPQNDQNFWFTNEYMGENGIWKTNINSFRMRLDSIDAEVVSVINPVDSSGLSSTEPVIIEIRNAGCDTIANVDYGFSLNGILIETGTYEDQLGPGETVEILMNNTIDLSGKGIFNFQAFTNFSDDTNVHNDSLTLQILSLPNFDLLTCNTGDVPSFSCSSEQLFAAQFTNQGTDTIVSFVAELYLNDALEHSIEWTGKLGQYESTNLDFPPVNAIAGLNNVKITFSNPNGMVEDQILDNNEIEFDFEYEDDATSATLSYQTDNFGFLDNSWEIVDENGNVIFSGNVDQTNAAVVDLCFQEACYVFRLFDSFGDGFGGDANAFLEIETEDGKFPVILDNVSFGSLWEMEFCIPIECEDIDYEIEYEDASGANKPDAAIYINYALGNNLTEYSIDGGVNYQNNPLFTNLVPGVYDIVIKASNGCTYEEAIEIGILSNTYDLEEINLVVSPNPTLGVLKVELTGYDGPRELRATIIDMQGKKVHSSQINKFSNGYLSTLYIPDLASGVYYLSIEGNDFRQLKQFIKQ